MTAFSLPVHGLLSGRTEGPPPRSGPGLGDGGPQARVLIPQADAPGSRTPTSLRVLGKLGLQEGTRACFWGAGGSAAALRAQAGISAAGRRGGARVGRLEGSVPGPTPAPPLVSQAPCPTRVSCSRLPCDVGSLGNPCGRTPVAGGHRPAHRQGFYPMVGVLRSGSGQPERSVPSHRTGTATGLKRTRSGARQAAAVRTHASQLTSAKKGKEGTKPL